MKKQFARLVLWVMIFITIENALDYVYSTYISRTGYVFDIRRTIVVGVFSILLGFLFVLLPEYRKKR